MHRNLIIGAVLAVAAIILASASLFTVNETQQALVLQLGAIKKQIREPGLKVKLPFVQNVVILDKRVLDLDPPEEKLILSDQKRLNVDAFARYRIQDPERFYQSLGSEQAAEQRLATVVNSALRRVLGSVTVLDVLSVKRDQIMTDLKAQVNQEATRFGIEIVDVRIRRADLPEEASQAIFNRMRSERVREAAEQRAQGEEEAQRIRASAERERTVTLAVAQRDSQILRGKGDQDALKIINEATGKDPEFYAFYRSLQAYRETLRAGDTTLVLSPDSDFFRYFERPDGAGPRKR
jgi:membrane protease subunit HflC